MLCLSWKSSNQKQTNLMITLFSKCIWLRSPLLSASLVAYLGWINRKALRQPVSVASLTSPLLSSVCSRAWRYISCPWLEGSFHIHQGSGAEQRAPLSLQRDAPRFGVKARTQIPLRRPHWVCSIWQTGSGGPGVLLDDKHSPFSLDIFQSRWYTRLPQS